MQLSSARRGRRSTSCCCRSRQARAWRGCRSRRPATCSSISRARASPARAAASTCSACGRRTGYRAWWALRRRGGAGGVRGGDRPADRRRGQAHPGMHVYHFAHYEPTAFKRLMGRYATRGDELDRLLRGRALRRSLRRRAPGAARRRRELLDQEARAVLRLHARRCRSTTRRPHAAGDRARARELRRRRHLRRRARGRPGLQPGRLPLDRGAARLARGAAGRGSWRGHGGAAAGGQGATRRRRRSRRCEAAEQAATRAAAGRRFRRGRASPVTRSTRAGCSRYLLDWHRREEKAAWWEYFRLRDLPDEDLLDERAADRRPRVRRARRDRASRARRASRPAR